MILEQRGAAIRTTVSSAPPRKILAVVTVDIMAWVLLRPWLESLQNTGLEVHIACAEGRYFDQLATAGFVMHPVRMRRTFNIFAHIRPLFELTAILRANHYVAINTHSPVAAALGRLAGALSGIYPVIYTVHGFYFHDRMSPLFRWPLIAMEWLFGRWTDAFMFVSDEDRRTARRLGISSINAPVCTISNGVDLQIFQPSSGAPVLLPQQGRLASGRPVVGIVGRIVKEKGYREFLEMAISLTASGIDATYLVVGDSLPSDRDQFGPVLRAQVETAGLSDRFVFTGMTDRVHDYLRLMDIFVLPSYREGFPRSVLEAMATGLPVVATDIRGCREAVAEGVTGHIVPPGNSSALREAVERLLTNPELRKRMGERARRIACKSYDQQIIAGRFAEFFLGTIGPRRASQSQTATPSLNPLQCVLISLIAISLAIAGLYLLPGLLEVILLRESGRVWQVVLAGDAPGCMIIGMLFGWRWGTLSYLSLSLIECLLLAAGVLNTASVIWVTNLVPTLIVIARLLPRVLRGHNWRRS